MALRANVRNWAPNPDQGCDSIEQDELYKHNLTKLEKSPAPNAALRVRTPQTPSTGSVQSKEGKDRMTEMWIFARRPYTRGQWPQNSEPWFNIERVQSMFFKMKQFSQKNLAVQIILYGSYWVVSKNFLDLNALIARVCTRAFNACTVVHSHQPKRVEPRFGWWVNNFIEL